MNTTDDMYNATTRHIQLMLKVYLNSTPLIVTKDDYLIDATILLEACSDGDSPFGNVTANQLNCTLLNLNGLFSPTNSDSIYYGKIKKGLKIEVYIKPVDNDEVEYDPLGIFYVTDWDTTITGITGKEIQKGLEHINPKAIRENRKIQVCLEQI